MLSAYETGLTETSQATDYPQQMKQSRKDMPSSRPRTSGGHGSANPLISEANIFVSGLAVPLTWKIVTTLVD